jgi:uncharacterized protein YceK
MKRLLNRIIIIQLFVIVCLLFSGCAVTKISYPVDGGIATYASYQNPFFLQDVKAKSGGSSVEIGREDAITEQKLSAITDAAVKAAMKSAIPTP